MLGQDVVGKGKAGDSQRIQLAVMAALLKEADLDRTMGDIQTALNEDQNFYGSSPSLQQTGRSVPESGRRRVRPLPTSAARRAPWRACRRQSAGC
jgi:hypothetical protein